MTPTLECPPSEMTQARFVEAFGGVYEHSPWVAEQAFANGLDAQGDSAEVLARLMGAIVDASPANAKLKLLRAHPDLAGKLAVAGQLTVESRSEQAGSGLDQCSPEELEKFQQLNSAYTSKFGFPFIIAVSGYQRAEILSIFEKRLGNAPEDEFAEAIAQVHRIARLRIANLIA